MPPVARLSLPSGFVGKVHLEHGRSFSIVYRGGGLPVSTADSESPHDIGWPARSQCLLSGPLQGSLLTPVQNHHVT